MEDKGHAKKQQQKTRRGRGSDSDRENGGFETDTTRELGGIMWGVFVPVPVCAHVNP